MSYVAVAVVRSTDGWAAAEVDLDGVEDLDGVSELLVDTGSELAGVGPVVLLLEEDEEYVAVVRAEMDMDPRVFLSDRRVTATSRVAAAIGEDLEATLPPAGDAAQDEPVDTDEEAQTSARPEVESAGDNTLLADLDVSADRLERLCAAEGMLPADVIYAVCEQLGCADLLDEIRGV